jgi:hypothetical protein
MTVLTIPQVEGVPAIFVFYCARCKHTEIKVQEDDGVALGIQSAPMARISPWGRPELF